MALGAVTAIATVVAVPVPVRCLGDSGLVFGMLFAVTTVVIWANQVLCGLALMLIGTGLAATVGKAGHCDLQAAGHPLS